MFDDYLLAAMISFAIPYTASWIILVCVKTKNKEGVIKMLKKILAFGLIIFGMLALMGTLVSAEIISAMTGAVIWLISIPVAIVATGMLKPKKKD